MKRDFIKYTIAIYTKMVYEWRSNTPFLIYEEQQ